MQLVLGIDELAPDDRGDAYPKALVVDDVRGYRF
jgi:hypothetical protein